ncbi:helix-turn-helix domain-containing protein [Streptomyces roseicoloratus]|uniref:helix-turn-helix domain-containing protein n=1 Tax=Streptomyces roseicoloratus TaxID=2508722 RepID=UPI001009AFAD|nr:helix-turn-helix transcriptional regulator [Streptomyces roseicoloratus]
MYDRTLLRAAAAAEGQHNYVDLAHHLKVAQSTAWRLWYGKNAPSIETASKVTKAYGLTLAQLLEPAEAAT